MQTSNNNDLLYLSASYSLNIDYNHEILQPLFGRRKIFSTFTYRKKEPKFRIVSDEVDNFKREICIDSDASFLELHDAILDSVGFSKDQMTSFFICDDDWEKKTEITLMDMGKDSDEDTWIMASTKLSDLIEDEGQRLVFVFDYMTDRMFFMELKEIEPGKDLETPVCTRKEGNPPQQTMDFEELEKKNAANNSSDFDETFYGDETFDPSELDEEGFADLNMDDEYNNM